jgi:N-formylglutamate amidohydrolase
MSLDALERRVDALHRPWHEAIGDSLSAARDRFGGALLIDLHSMPRQPGGTPQFVIGDRHGATVSSELAEHMLALAEGAGLKAARNMPYAGAYTVQRHGHVGSGIEAVQIEIDRSLYLGSDDMPHAGADEIARLILAIATMAENSIHGTRWPMAAE